MYFKSWALYAGVPINMLFFLMVTVPNYTLKFFTMWKANCRQLGTNVILIVMQTSLLTFFKWDDVVNTFVMRLAELFYSSASFRDQVFRHGQHNAEEGWVEEARKAGEGLNALFFGKSLRKLQACRELRESLKINADHHIHRLKKCVHLRTRQQQVKTKIDIPPWGMIGRRPVTFLRIL